MGDNTARAPVGETHTRSQPSLIRVAQGLEADDPDRDREGREQLAGEGFVSLKRRRISRSSGRVLHPCRPAALSDYSSVLRPGRVPWKNACISSGVTRPSSSAST
jgi:hypothetical protein